MLARCASAVRAFVVPVLGDRSGVAAVLLAVALIPMVGAVGLAIDSSIGYLLKARMSKSLDAAGLAAGRHALDDDAEAIARDYFEANFGEDLGADFVFDLDDDMRHVTLSATATRPTYFMRVFGHDEMTVSARTVIERETTGMELALVLDNTGSMQDFDKFETMQQAAYDLIEILYGEEDTIENLWVSVVPFVASVNIGSGRTSWLAANDRKFTAPASWDNQGWKGCVMARAYPYDTDDTPPAAQRFTSFFWATSKPSNDWKATNININRGPNLACGAPIKPLTASRAEIDSALGAMAAAPKRGGTTANLGLVWGWRTLSPRWRGLWGGSTPAELPLDYDIGGEEDDQMEKVAVVLTDGKNQLVHNDYTAYGFPSAMGYARTSDSVEMLDDRMIEVCDAMKAEGIRIYSIIFGEEDLDARELFEDCATSPSMYYYAPENEDLADAFSAIGGQLAKLRIIE